LDLDEVLIGGREKREIVIVDYDATWPARFEAERARVQQALGACALRIEHIGSTAVPGLAAKPIVDLLVTLEDLDDVTATVAALTAVGYELRVREPGHRMFRTPQHDVHVHIWGPTRISESRAICDSATGSVSHPRIVTPTSNSNENWHGLSGPT
jgi:GrpB-like predicted nucleotidyltransferase (UPF0157 family)